MTGQLSLVSKRGTAVDENTQIITSLVRETDLTGREDLLQQGKIAFIDYLAALLAARREDRVSETARFISSRPGTVPLVGQPYQSAPEYAAFFNGFCSHYLDYDDAQANIAGHFSTVLFSVLLALAEDGHTVRDFLTAYAAGAELEGLLGACVNPAHKQQGWHSTGTIGPIGAAAAIARFKGLNQKETAQLLSLGATQSSGMGFEAGTDTKPLHSGFAARNAVFAFELLRETKLTSSLRTFNNDTGWLQTIAGQTFEAEDFARQWLKPGQIISPGLWMKLHPYCSAGICGAAACKELYDRGFRLDQLDRVVFHFPPGADKALRYRAPETGQEGRFSMEYVAWQLLSNGKIDDNLFKLPHVPNEFRQALPKFERKNDLPPVEKSVRLTKVSVYTTDGGIEECDIRDPLGSPSRPFTESDLQEKLIQATSAGFAQRLLTELEHWPDGTLAGVLKLLRTENIDQ